MTFAVVVAMFALGGFWLDGKLGTSPLFVLLGILLGLLGGTIHLLRTLSPGTLPFGRRPPAQRTKDQQRPPPPPT